MSGRRWLAALVLGGSVLAACGEGAPRLTAGPDVAVEFGIDDPADLRYRCGGFPFDAAIFLEPGDDELGTSPAAAALRKYVATPAAKRDGARESGWYLLGADETYAEFVAKAESDGDEVLQLISVEDGWRTSFDPVCRPELDLPAAVGLGSWSLDPDAPEPGQQTRVLRVVVEEHTCTSGRPPLGRIVGPLIFPAHDRIHVLFGVRPLDGAQTCQRSPSSTVEIDLGEAIGDRSLVDPSYWPLVIVDVE
jgi:hypothetical protein